jgi:hypothetical protein
MATHRATAFRIGRESMLVSDWSKRRQALIIGVCRLNFFTIFDRAWFGKRRARDQNCDHQAEY